MSRGSGSKHIILLPVLEDLTNHPMCFDVGNPDEAEVAFQLVRLRNYSEDAGELVGSGVAMINTLKERLASKHESLVRDHTIPILAKDMLAIIGRITFSFLIIGPFAHSAAPRVATHGFWNNDERTEIVGHLGSGANTTAKTSLQIGENTIQSFMSAMGSGASCVEFDVQLTKDLFPVIFHDFLVMETGGDVPLHTLTRDQFIHLSNVQSSKASSWKGNDRSGSGHSRALRAGEPRPRSLSETQYGDGRGEDTGQRMKYTEEGIRNEIKGNLRGFSILEPSTTLGELFTKLPESVAFNLEMSKCFQSSHDEY